MLNDTGLYIVDEGGRVRVRADRDHHLELVRSPLAALQQWLHSLVSTQWVRIEAFTNLVVFAARPATAPGKREVAFLDIVLAHGRTSAGAVVMGRRPHGIPSQAG